ncbi:hypothetical protein KXJ69_11845 [Aureisphaera sp. CAU 1614]|uniref:Uncharacterized protein n=1 Tax=Halomarinibacterium sedimenti TaxID=2857106 RepID=A0A9X1FRL0_9FLAO|nr:hypothetical protein [Halomarinibacterium sedimenti]MBW2938804.1 hypothetical protein [Halomarinibacterium sedimenti]
MSSINQIVTPLDSAVLETKEQYQVYFKIVNHAFGELFKSIAERTICNPLEISFLEQYCELITYSLEAFRVKYLYNDEDKMKIDVTESGFPNYLEFRYLINDLALKNEHIAKLPKIDTLKAEFLEGLLKYKTPVSRRKLEQAASIVYYTSVDARYIFKRFVQGKIQKIENNPNAPYLISWSFYDVGSNRPFVCFMYFDLYKTTVEEYTQEIYEILEKVADRDMSLDMMAYAIDKKLPKLLPRKLRKIDLGPIHNVFAKDELQVTHCILEGIVNKVLDLSAHAISLTVEDIETKGSFKEGSFFSKQDLQIWEAQKPRKYLFSPHRVIQVVYDRIPDFLNNLTEEPIEIPTLKL